MWLAHFGEAKNTTTEERKQSGQAKPCQASNSKSKRMHKQASMHATNSQARKPVSHQAIRNQPNLPNQPNEQTHSSHSHEHVTSHSYSTTGLTAPFLLEACFLIRIRANKSYLLCIFQIVLRLHYGNQAHSSSLNECPKLCVPFCYFRRAYAAETLLPI